MASLDNKIVTALAANSKPTLNELATRFGIPTSTLHQRIKKLEAKGVITGYRATLNQNAVGLTLHALVSLTPIDPSRPDDIPERLSPIEEIESCWSVAGATAYIIKVAVPDAASLEGLLARIRSAGNVSTNTNVILSTAFEDRQAAISPLWTT